MSASKTTSNDCLKVRQTMFEFLKRKKQNQLEMSLRQFSDSSKKQYDLNRTSSIHKRDTHSRAKSSAMYEDIVIEEHDTIPLISVKKSKFNHTASITPRKITFAGDQIEDKPQSSRKPLLELISPIKNISRTVNKNNESLSKFSKEKQRYQQKQKSNPRKSILKQNILRKNNSEPFSKKQLNISINNLKQTFQKMFDAGQMAKEKNSQLSIALVNFVKDLEKNRGKENFSIDKKLGDVKYILNAIDSSLEIFKDSAQASQVIEQFQKNFYEHLNQLESCSNHNLKTQYEEEIMRISTQKQYVIDDLSDQSLKLERQIQKLNKLLQKTQRQYEAELDHQNERQQNLLETIQNLKRQNLQTQEISEQKLTQIQQKLEEQKTNSKQLQKQLKDILYKQQKSITSQQAKRAQQAMTRQAFLLREMESHRHTFNADISQLHKLYQTKQLQHQKRIQTLTAQLQKQIYERKCDRQVSDRILNEANINRADVIKFTKKNQQLVQDLYRMNEDLFQHWLALKDLKTLSERLHIFQHFQRIYLDLAFNPNLFRI